MNATQATTGVNFFIVKENGIETYLGAAIRNAVTEA